MDFRVYVVVSSQRVKDVSGSMRRNLQRKITVHKRLNRRLPANYPREGTDRRFVRLCRKAMRKTRYENGT